MIWYPNVSVSAWLRIHPALDAFLPIKCSCGCELELKPYVTSDSYGLEAGPCACPLNTQCNTYFSRDEEFNRKVSSFLKEWYAAYKQRGK